MFIKTYNQFINEDLVTDETIKYSELDNNLQNLIKSQIIKYCGLISFNKNINIKSYKNLIIDIPVLTYIKEYYIPVYFENNNYIANDAIVRNGVETLDVVTYLENKKFNYKGNIPLNYFVLLLTKSQDKVYITIYTNKNQDLLTKKELPVGNISNTLITKEISNDFILTNSFNNNYITTNIINDFNKYIPYENLPFVFVIYDTDNNKILLNKNSYSFETSILPVLNYNVTNKNNNLNTLLNIIGIKINNIKDIVITKEDNDNFLLCHIFGNSIIINNNNFKMENLSLLKNKKYVSQLGFTVFDHINKYLISGKYGFKHRNIIYIRD